MARIIGPTLVAILGFHPTGDLGPLTIYTSSTGKIVAYPNAPPKNPPTYYQIARRNRFRLVADAWSHTPQAKRDQWNLAAARTGAAIHGYTLFTYYQIKHDRAAIRTIERQTFTQLIP